MRGLYGFTYWVVILCQGTTFADELAQLYGDSEENTVMLMWKSLSWDPDLTGFIVKS